MTFSGELSPATPDSLSGYIWRRSWGSSSRFCSSAFVACLVRNAPVVGVSPAGRAVWGVVHVDDHCFTVFCVLRPLATSAVRLPLACAARAQGAEGHDGTPERLADGQAEPRRGHARGGCPHRRLHGLMGERGEEKARGRVIFLPSRSAFAAYFLAFAGTSFANWLACFCAQD